MIYDARAKEKHKGILMMVIMDLQPWSMVNDPGFLYFSSQMDPHYKVASDKLYRGLLDKAFKKGVTKVEDKKNKDNPEFDLPTGWMVKLQAWVYRPVGELHHTILEEGQSVLVLWAL